MHEFNRNINYDRYIHARSIFLKSADFRTEIVVRDLPIQFGRIAQEILIDAVVEVEASLDDNRLDDITVTDIDISSATCEATGRKIPFTPDFHKKLTAEAKAYLNRGDSRAELIIRDKVESALDSTFHDCN